MQLAPITQLPRVLGLRVLMDGSIVSLGCIQHSTDFSVETPFSLSCCHAKFHRSGSSSPFNHILSIAKPLGQGNRAWSSSHFDVGCLGLSKEVRKVRWKMVGMMLRSPIWWGIEVDIESCCDPWAKGYCWNKACLHLVSTRWSTLNKKCVLLSLWVGLLTSN